MSKPLAFIIEDNKDIAYIFAEAVGDAGFETEIMMTGKKAKDRLANSVPALVILDLYLPDIHGTELLELIRSDSRLAATRVIVATAEARMAEGLHEKADLVLTKPVSFFQLRDLASRLVRPFES